MQTRPGPGGLAAAIDEVQVSNMMRSPQWLRAAAIGRHPMSKLAQCGGDEGGGGREHGAVLRTLLNAVSMDGWSIIGLIGLLGELEMRLRQDKAADPELPVVGKGDASVQYHKVIEVLRVMKRLQIAQLGLVMDRLVK